MIREVITGGQTGADIAGWRAAKSVGIRPSGFMPQGFITESGARPEYAREYNAVEAPSTAYSTRTRHNVHACQAVIWFGNADSTGGQCTLTAAEQLKKPVIVVTDGMKPSEVADRINAEGWRRIMVAGNRESVSPGIEARVERFCRAMLRMCLEDGG